MSKLVRTFPHRLQGLVFSLLLSACAAPVLMMSPQGQLMWALLKPMVGLDPGTLELWNQPMFKGRMTALLGDDYGTAMQLLRTANQLQQEGPLFFIVSRSTPIPDVAKGAGLVWNADTNQMAAMIARGDGVDVFAEYVKETLVASAGEAAAQAVPVVAPTWPAAMQPWLTAAQEIRQQSPGQSR